MALLGLFKSRPGIEAGRRLYSCAVEQARRPEFYLRYGVPDTPLGRFELYTLHTVLLVVRLKGRGAQAAETVQALFDAYLEGLDIGLREMGVGDLSMGKKMKKLGRAFYGRVGSWEAALSDPAACEALIARTVYETAPGAEPRPLADYAARAFDGLVAQPDAQLLQGEANWPKETP